MSIIIHLATPEASQKKPWPIVVNGGTFRVSSGLGDDDLAFLLGFADVGEQKMAVSVQDALADPDQAKGRYPIFAANDGTGIFNWEVAVDHLELTS